MNALEMDPGIKVLVVGGGIFGTRALMHSKREGNRTLVIDIDGSCRARSQCESVVKDFSDIGSGKAGFMMGKAVNETFRILSDDPPDVIAPCIPGHLAGLVLEKAMEVHDVPYVKGSRRMIDVMSRLDPDLVFKSDLHSGTLVTSLMTPGGTCDPGCGQPEDRCPVSGMIKGDRMDAILSEACSGTLDASLVLTSNLVGPGVGCFNSKQLIGFIETVVVDRAPISVAVGTSCSCHGILSFYDVWTAP